MSNLTVQSIKTFNKHELKPEVTNLGLDGQGKKKICKPKQ